MSKADKKKFEKDFIKNFKIESVLNREGEILPYAFFNPQTEGRVTWACGEAHNGKITSVFKYVNSKTNEEEKNCEYVTLEKAKEMRKVLIQEGWRKNKAPGVTLKHPDTGKPLNRTQRRKLAKHLVKNDGILESPTSKRKKKPL